MRPKKQENKPPPVQKRVLNGDEPKSSASIHILQTLFYFDDYYTTLVTVVTLLLSLFKVYALPFPKGYFAIEILVLCIYYVLVKLRLNFGMVGNRIESKKYMFLMIFFLVFSIVCNIYFMARQTYILRVEMLVHGMALFLAAFELLMGMGALILFWKQEM